MANVVTLTRTNKYVETPFTVNVTGSNLKDKYIQIFFAEKRYADSEASWIVDLVEQKLTNNTTFSTEITPTQAQLDDVYYFAFDTNELRINILIWDGLYQKLVTNYSFLTYIEPVKPTFDGTPSYTVTDTQSLTFTNNNKKIINGLSTVHMTGLKGTAYKDATIKYIKINEINYPYSVAEINNYIIDTNNFTLPTNYSNFVVQLIDSRGFKSEIIKLADFTQIIDYHKPIITNFTVERDGISATTKLYMSGIYTEGYEEGIETLTPSYKYQEILSDGSGTIENGTTTTFTITKEPTIEWQDYQAILEEYNNPHYEEEQMQDEYDNIYTFTYYTKAVFENGINDLFEIALKYNNKYTQEDLERDYSASSERYYCKSSGYYDTGWHAFWQDTLRAIKQTMYGSYIYGQADKDYGVGGNYEFEIESNAIQGDIQDGFSLDKAFNIWGYVDEGTEKEAFSSNFLPTAIPAIDVFKDKVALHGLFDENISDSDIQFWGNVYLNGSKINSGLKQIIQTTGVASYSTSYSYFAPFNGANNIDLDIDTTNNLTYGSKVVSYGDRTNNTVYGFTIGSNVNLIKVSFSVRYFNNHSSSVAVNTLIDKVSGDYPADIVYGTSTTIPSSGRLTQTGTYYLEVEEGDFIFLAGFRATKSADIDVIATDNATNMSVEIIG